MEGYKVLGKRENDEGARRTAIEVAERARENGFYRPCQERMLPPDKVICAGCNGMNVPKLSRDKSGDLESCQTFCHLLFGWRSLLAHRPTCPRGGVHPYPQSSKSSRSPFICSVHVTTSTDTFLSPRIRKNPARSRAQHATSVLFPFIPNFSPNDQMIQRGFSLPDPRFSSSPQ